jgi:autotransporter-associated beta strand protein
MITRLKVVLIAAAAFVISAPLWSAQSLTSVWTGAGPNDNWSTASNWQNGAVPASGADVTLNALPSQKSILLDASPIVNSLTISSGYDIYGSNDSGTLTIGSGGLTVNSPAVYSYIYAYFDGNTSIAPGAPQTWTIGNSSGLGYSSLSIYGNITGSTAAPLNALVYGSLTLAGNNNFSGTVTLESSGALYAGSDTALGNATLIVNGGGSISNWWNDRTLANAVTLNGGIVDLYANANSLAFNGPITVTNPADIGVWGPGPVVISGSINESGGSKSISMWGDGMLVLKGSLGITGGVSVNNGLVIIGSSAAVPAAGAVGVYGDAYLGLDMATGITATQFISRLDPASSGTIGFDTATLSSPATIADPVDLSRFTGDPRLGTATSAKLAGTITPGGNGYSFGGGGGTLEVASNLTGSNDVNLYSPYSQSLALILSGTNTYTGNTVVANSLLRFSNSLALPNFDANETGIYFQGQGYVGLDYTPTSGQLTDLWSNIFTNDNTAVIGFDSPIPATPNTVTISTDTLQSLPAGAYLGTSTSATIGITKGDASMPSSIAFAAVRDGNLTVSSLPSGTYGVTIGLPNDGVQTAANDYTYDSRTRGTFATPNSTVTLQSANTYSGGTTLRGGRLQLGNSAALGTGPLAIAGSSILGTTVDGLTIANALVTPSDSSLTLDATNSFSLSGAISGSGSILENGAGILTLVGASPLFTGNLDVEGTLNVANDAALGNASLYVNGVINLNTPAPTIGNFNGGWGTINLNSAALPIDITGSGTFYGTIGGTGGLILNSGYLYLSGNNTYSGGTTVNAGSISSPSALISDNSNALGSGPVSVLGGSLYLNSNTTLTNSLTFGSGTIGGLGTFSPPVGVVIGRSQVVAPGLTNFMVSEFGSTAIGTLNFGTGLTLASGGTYQWALGNASGAAGTGWDEILVTGTLTITSTSGAPFALVVFSPSNSQPFDNTHSYSWTIASASGGITGFDPGAFTIDLSGFPNDLGGGGFFLTQGGNDLALNFSSVPEPSTYALMALGLGVVAIGLRRKTRRAH